MSNAALERLILGCAVLAAIYLPGAFEFATEGFTPGKAPSALMTTVSAPQPAAHVIAAPPADQAAPVAPVQLQGRPGF
ncbi:MAG: hypothetical protein VYE81_04010 [Planctomycetota bacterium]|nr:hypothetical protein [Planctomycetota bacterium]